MTYIAINAPLYQWDRGRYVTITLTQPKVEKVQFVLKGEQKALSVKPYENEGNIVAKIPDILLQQDGKLIVYLTVGAGENEYTIDERTFTINPKVRPEDYIYTEDEKLVWHELDMRIGTLEENLAGLDGNLIEYIDESIAALPVPARPISEIGQKTGLQISVDLQQFFDMNEASVCSYYNDLDSAICKFFVGSQTFLTATFTGVDIIINVLGNDRRVRLIFPEGAATFERVNGIFSLDKNLLLNNRDLNSGYYKLVKSINDIVPDASGNIKLDYTTNGVQYTEQPLSFEEQNQARANMDLYYVEKINGNIQYHTIPEEFIPDTIARSAAVPAVGGYELVGSAILEEPVSSVVIKLSKPCSHFRVAAYREGAGFFVSKSNIETAVNGNLSVWAHKDDVKSSRGIWVQGNSSISATVQQPLAFCDVTILPNGRAAAIGWIQRSSGGYSGTPSGMTSDLSSIVTDGTVSELYFNESGNSNLINAGVRIYVWGC